MTKRKRYADSADWSWNGPYQSFVLSHRQSGNTQLIFTRQPAGHYPDPAMSRFSLQLVKACQGSIEVDFGMGRTQRNLVPGLLSVSPSDTECDFVQNGTCEFFALGIETERVRQISEQATGVIAPDLGSCHGFFMDPFIESLVYKLWEDAESPSVLGSLYSDQILNLLTASLLIRSGRKTVTPDRSNPLVGTRLQRVLDYIESHLSSSIALDDLAGIAHISAFHFARLFKRATNFTPHQYVIWRRVERAKLLIRASKVPNYAVIAAEVGFCDQSHFVRHFRRIVGCTPSQLS
jgi:AraC family transcriptional regulator